MNEEFLIHIDGKMEQQGEWDHVDLLTRGSLVQKGSNFFISYQESDATGYAGCTTTVKAAADSHKVTMIRFGSAASQLIIEKGTRHVCHYETGHGSLSLGVAADTIENNLTSEGGTLSFSYTLDADQDTVLSRNLVTIHVRRAQPNSESAPL